jgi:hypothetical protein
VDLRGFDPSLVRHTMKTARQKHRIVNSALKATFRRDLGDFFRTEMFFFQSTMKGFQIGNLLRKPMIILEPLLLFELSGKQL